MVMEPLKVEEREKLQRLLAEMNDGQAVVELLRQQASALAGSLSELNMTVGALKSLKELQPSADILVPLGSDTFIPAKLISAERVLVGLGADVMVERTVEEAIKFLEARIAEVEKAIEQTRTELKKVEERIEAIKPEAEKLLLRAREATGK
ncbi:MAG: prefoldin subunit alpha [Candidatus Hadarchaeum sp.]|uniref:prefoldin subunit alpha n=1 Tax=Candidatus Hadarchaeum sp. TaxID=2883567 RepID=UPI003D1227F8